jgi:hypothetical protein
MQQERVRVGAEFSHDERNAYLRDGSSDIAVEAMAERAGVVVRAISRFYHAVRPRPGLMLGFSGFPRQLIVPSAARLARIVAASRSSSSTSNLREIRGSPTLDIEK